MISGLGNLSRSELLEPTGPGWASDGDAAPRGDGDDSRSTRPGASASPAPASPTRTQPVPPSAAPATLLQTLQPTPLQASLWRAAGAAVAAPSAATVAAAPVAVAAGAAVGGAAPAPPAASTTTTSSRERRGAWLEQREAALAPLRADYEAQRAQAMARPGASGWVAAVPVQSHDGDAAYAGDAVVTTDGRAVTFDDAAFRAHYAAQVAQRNPSALQALARCWGTDVAGLTAAGGRAGAPGIVAQLVELAAMPHAANAGPAPAGIAMGQQLGALDLYLTEPQIRELIATHGGTPAPATSAQARE